MYREEEIGTAAGNIDPLVNFLAKVSARIEDYSGVLSHLCAPHWLGSKSASLCENLRCTFLFFDATPAACFEDKFILPRIFVLLATSSKMVWIDDQKFHFFRGFGKHLGSHFRTKIRFFILVPKNGP